MEEVDPQDGELGFTCKPDCGCDRVKGVPPQSKYGGLLCPLGGLKAKGPQLLAHASTGITWEKITLTVDSGASDIAVPLTLPQMVRNKPF